MIRGSTANEYYVGILVKREERLNGLETYARHSDNFLAASGLIINLAERISWPVIHVGLDPYSM
jgi:hypothetical protein